EPQLGYAVVGTVCGAEAVPDDAVLAYLRPFEEHLVWADNDPDGKGQKHIQRTASSMQRLGMHPRLVTWADAPVKGDAHDWVERDGTTSALQVLVDAATEIADAVEERFPRANLGEVARKGIQPRQMLVPNFIYEGRAHTLHGPS